MPYKSKYHAKKTEIDGIIFDSIKESRRYCELKLLVRGNVIRDLKLQPVYPMMVNGKKICTYRGDFEYTENGVRVCEDVKGMKTPVYRLKRKLFLALYPEIEHRET